MYLHNILILESEHGVIFVSFGSMLKGSLMSEKMRKIFTNAFGKLKQRVLWKWESEEMEGKPDNVMLSKWLPQQDLLAHPNLKIFISHMGQSSSQEALCHQVPVVRQFFSDSLKQSYKVCYLYYLTTFHSFDFLGWHSNIWGSTRKFRGSRTKRLRNQYSIS